MKKFALLLGMFALLASRAWGLFGVGDTVIIAADPLRESQWGVEAARWAEEIRKWEQQLNQYSQMLGYQDFQQALQGDLRVDARTVLRNLPTLASKLGANVNLPGVYAMEAQSNPTKVQINTPEYFPSEGAPGEYVVIGNNYHWRDKNRYTGLGKEWEAIKNAKEASNRLAQAEVELVNAIVVLQNQMATQTMTESQMKANEALLNQYKGTLELYRIQQERTDNVARLYAQMREMNSAQSAVAQQEEHEFRRAEARVQARRMQSFNWVPPPPPPRARLTP